MLPIKIFLFGVAFALSAALTALMLLVAPRMGLVDHPDRRRKLHAGPIPLGGGLAIYTALSLVLAGIVLLAPRELRELLTLSDLEFTWLPVAAALIVLIGTIDDRFGLRGRSKLAGQLVVAGVLVAGGMVVRDVTLFGHTFDLGLLSIPFTMFWILGAINSVNLLDGIDGLAASIGLIMVAAIALMAFLVGHVQVQLLAIVFGGTLVGFLIFNFPPARIFLGDAGSMLIGLLVGVLAIRASLKGAGTVLLAAPMAICTIPIMDSAAAVLRRKLTGRSIYATDRGHLHHRLLSRLGTRVRVLVWVGAICALTGMAALCTVLWNSDLIAAVTCLAVLGVIVATDMFGRAELFLVANRIGGLGRSLFQPLHRVRRSGRGTTLHIQGTRNWKLLWQSLTEAGEKYALSRIDLDLDLPSVQESFSATWRGPGAREADERREWSLEIPLWIADQTAGSLAVTGQRNGHFPPEEIEQLMELVEQFESRSEELLDRHLPKPESGTVRELRPASEDSIDSDFVIPRR